MSTPNESSPLVGSKKSTMYNSLADPVSDEKVQRPPHSNNANNQYPALLLRESMMLRATGQAVSVTLTTEGLQIGDYSVAMEDVVGADLHEDHFTVHAYLEPTPSCCGSVDRVHHGFKLNCNKPEVVRLWVRRIKQLVRKLPLDDVDPPARTFLVLVNPASGPGTAEQIYQEHCAPVFAHADIVTEVVVTKYAAHATDITLNMDIRRFNAVIGVGGDGVMSEIVNGIMGRADWADAIKVPIGVLPGGSGNGLAKTVCTAAGEVYSPTNAAFVAANGHSRPLDLFTVSQANHPLKYGFLGFSWAIVSDVDFESEKWRCCGATRFTIAALIRLCCLRTYSARIEVLVDADVPVRKDVSQASRKFPLPDVPVCQRQVDCATCIAPTQTAPIFDQSGIQALSQYIQLRSAGAGPAEEKGQAVANANAAGAAAFLETEPVDLWEHINDEFTFIWMLNIPFPSSSTKASPFAHLSDGQLDLLCCRAPIGKMELLSTFLDLDAGDHINHDQMEYRKVRGFRLTPDMAATQKSELNMDGERLPYAPMEIRVFRGVLRLLTR